jgi:hypothetical protein
MASATTSPVHFDIQRPASQSRITNFPLGIGMLIRAILLIPHLVILYFFGVVAQLLVLIGQIAILFTGNFPQGMFNLVVGYQRWSSSAYAYLFHLYDAYPPFGPDETPGYPLSLEIDYPNGLSRFLNFPILGFFIKFILLIPHIIILVFLYIVAYLILIIAPFAILFTGSFPAGMHGFLVGVGRWGQRVSAYLMALTDAYPPFGMN